MAINDDSIEAATLGKIGARIVPFLALLYFAAFVDRSGVSFAAQGMSRDLGFSATVYGFGAGIFFIGYILMEVPSNLMLHKVGVRRWIARIALTWGVLAGAMALVGGATSFYVMRFLLGAAEAGLFPGIVYYLTLWVPARRRGHVIGLFMTAIPLSTALGGPVASVILLLDGAAGLTGWQWLFLLETIPSLVLGVVTLFYLPDRPADARWLAEEERDWLTRTLDAEAHHREIRHGAGGWHMLADLPMLLLCLAYSGIELASYGMILWVPQIFAATGIPAAWVGAVVAIPYGIAAICMVLWCRLSDRANDRITHIVAASLLSFVGLAASAFLTAQPVLSVVAITLGVVGTLAALPIFWTLPGERLNGATAAAGIALINAVGHVGAFGGPFLIGAIKDATGSFTYGLLVVAGGMLLTAIVAPLLARNRAETHAGLPPGSAPA